MVELVSVAIAAVGLVLLGIGPHIGGYRTLTMRTGSMAPVIDPGDLVVVRSEPVSALRTGQIVTFAAPVAGAPVYTHRVVQIDRQGPDAIMRTKGDANAVADPWSAQPTGHDVWYVVLVVPQVGRAVAALNHPIVRPMAVYALPAGLCLEILMRLWGPRLIWRRRAVPSPGTGPHIGRQVGANP